MRDRVPTVAPASPTGERMVAVATARATALDRDAAARDRAGRFPAEVVGQLHGDGIAAMCVAPDAGGSGVASWRDVMAVVARLAHGDGSIAIATNMHLSFIANTTRSGAAPALMAAVGRGEAWVCAAVTEPGTNYFHPATELRPVGGGGWRLRGAKAFATASPVATHFGVQTVVRGGELDGRLAMVVVSADTPGVDVADDWDGVGMRASGSGRLRFDCELGADALVMPAGRYGELAPGALVGRAIGNLGNLAAMVGIAEGAALIAVDRVADATRVEGARVVERPTVRQAVGEMIAELHVAVSVANDMGRMADELDPGVAGDLEAAHRFMARFQATKIAVHRSTSAVVERAMDVCGGSAYTAGHPLARRYRDVRAGPFMEPFARHEGLGYIGAVTTGHPPDPRS